MTRKSEVPNGSTLSSLLFVQGRKVIMQGEVLICLLCRDRDAERNVRGKLGKKSLSRCIVMYEGQNRQRRRGFCPGNMRYRGTREERVREGSKGSKDIV